MAPKKQSHFEIGGDVMHEEDMDRTNALFFLVSRLDIHPAEVRAVRHRLGMDTNEDKED